MNRWSMLRAALTAGASSMTLMLAGAAAAQTSATPSPDAPAPAEAGAVKADDTTARVTPTQTDTGAAAGAAGDIVVTGSRAITDGAAQPTPVTVVSAGQLASAQPGNIAEALTQLPVFTGSFKPSSAGSNHSATGGGSSLLALRGLNPTRTLVLLDGRRIVNTTINGTTDVSLVPQGLVSRVDIVTGGASAAYGSDAVAGVANFVLDSRYSGIKGFIQGGQSSRSDAGSMKANLTVGQRFADGRAHLVVSGDYFLQKGIDQNYGGRGWADAGWAVVPESTTSSRVVVIPDARDVLGSYGGTITACQPAGAACPLRLTQFNPDGTLRPFAQGTFISATNMSGGDGTPRRTALLPGSESKNIFGRLTFDASSALSVFVEGNYGDFHSDYLAALNTNQLGSAAFTIFADNAYLSPAIRSTLTSNGITSFTLFRVNRDFQPVRYYTDTNTYRIAGGISGRLGEQWRYSAYGQYGKARSIYRISPNEIMDNVYNAADAVRNPATGQIVCRSTLLGTVAGPGCVPINLFGEGSPSPAALQYVTGVSTVQVDSSQLVGAADVRGDLFSLWSRPVSIAFGGEYRRERGEVSEDAITAGTRNGTGIRGFPAAQQGLFGRFLYSINGLPLKGEFDVKEGFVEVNAPIVADRPFLSTLDLNGAVRYADYSTAGGQTTWKLGAIYEPVPDIRLRATRSRDVRAPNIAELFTVGNQINGATASDPQRGGTRTIFIQRQTGNTMLQAERADSYNLGVVLKPRFLPGLTASVDYFNINIRDVISQPTVQQVVDQCGLSPCDRIQRAPDGTINVVTTPFQNLARLKTDGEDYELSYRTRLGNGTLSLRALATHTRKLALVVNGVEVDRVGDLNVIQNTNPPAAVEWTGTANIDWRNDRLHVFVQERYIGPGHLDDTLVYAPGTDTSVPAIFYTDLTIGYTLPTRTAKMEIYGTINNLLDQDPPITPNGASTTPRAANGGIYDFLGRYFTVGVRMQF
ncbi:MAG: TonB-dependent receptor [Sphingomonas bacterium]|uniref:TonB-dependent receptor domain-containing protein n=1 Tax=Sphingomonas bacterium TaxID=1895847 RepID=UPI0026085FA8|nr:TonB-dependent receptor [Sphingomonas bacterium]MDB5694603.1 TonB-dependent receptor [Sphingomonas bacterium]